MYQPPYIKSKAVLNRFFRKSGLLFLLGLASSASAQVVNFDIQINYTGAAQFESAFTDAEARWVSIIGSYIDGKQGAATFGPLVINASMEPIAGPGNVLGSAGPNFIAQDDSGYVLTTEGSMRFDSEDLTVNNLFLQNVVMHEMGHVIGIGTLWELNNLYDPAAPAVIDPLTGESVGQYLGPEALAAYRAEFDPAALYVPIEKGGGGGTANGHWDEIDGGGNTGRISLITGEDMTNEVMTGWANGSLFVSNLTRGGVRDLGYNAELLPVPEPTGTLLLGVGSLCLLARRRR